MGSRGMSRSFLWLVSLAALIGVYTVAAGALHRPDILPTTQDVLETFGALVVRGQAPPADEMHHEHHHHHHSGTSILDQEEMRSAVEVRHRSMFYLEVQVGSSDWETCNRIASSLVARRGENHLHRRYMIVRQRLYRRRFPDAYPPLLLL